MSCSPPAEVQNLQINKARIAGGSLDAGDIFANEGREPALRFCAIERVVRFCGQRMVVILNLPSAANSLRQACSSGIAPRWEV
jgi:hypothetical protein